MDEPLLALHYVVNFDRFGICAAVVIASSFLRKWLRFLKIFSVSELKSLRFWRCRTTSRCQSLAFSETVSLAKNQTNNFASTLRGQRSQAFNYYLKLLSDTAGDVCPPRPPSSILYENQVATCALTFYFLFLEGIIWALHFKPYLSLCSYGSEGASEWFFRGDAIVLHDIHYMKCCLDITK